MSSKQKTYLALPDDVIKHKRAYYVPKILPSGAAGAENYFWIDDAGYVFINAYVAGTRSEEDETIFDIDDADLILALSKHPRVTSEWLAVAASVIPE